MYKIASHPTRFFNTKVLKLVHSLLPYSIGEIKKWKSSFFHLINPVVCEYCDLELINEETILCCFCKEHLPYTYFESFEEKTPVQLKFGNIPNVEDVYSLLSFKKEGVTQILIHGLKYNFKSNIGLFLGRLLAEKWDKEERTDIDVLLPVPIHPRKKFNRGYNQSECISIGMQEIWQTPIDVKCIVRVKHSESLTKKNKHTRFEAVQNVFSINTDRIMKYNHVAIVDDVLTTGATLSVIIDLILKANPKIRITIFTIAITT